MAEELLFVYGTLRQGGGSPLLQKLSEHAAFVSKGRFRGRLYLVSDYPGVVASDDFREWVMGEVYALRHPETVLAELDRYEECGPGFAEPTEYVRCRQDIQLENGATCSAWVYLYNLPTANLRLLPSGDFLSGSD